MLGISSVVFRSEQKKSQLERRDEEGAVCKETQKRIGL